MAVRVEQEVNPPVPTLVYIKSELPFMATQERLKRHAVPQISIQMMLSLCTKVLQVQIQTNRLSEMKNLDNDMFIWLGKGASDREKIGAEEAVEAISNKAEGINKVTVKEGEEDDTFWYVSNIIYGTGAMEVQCSLKSLI